MTNWMSKGVEMVSKRARMGAGTVQVEDIVAEMEVEAQVQAKASDPAPVAPGAGGGTNHLPALDLNSRKKVLKWNTQCPSLAALPPAPASDLRPYP